MAHITSPGQDPPPRIPVVTTRIYVSSRPHWYQMTPDEPGDGRTIERMREIVQADFVRLGQRDEVRAIAYREGFSIVTAVSGRARHCESCSCVEVAARPGGSAPYPARGGNPLVTPGFPPGVEGDLLGEAQ